MKANSYTGVDLSAKYIAIAQRRHPDGRFIAMDARHMVFEDASFDLAMFVGVLHHMKDELAIDCLSDVRRVIKPAGHVIVAEPVFASGKYLSTLLLSCDRGRYIRSEEGYRQLFNGFAIERQRYFNFSAHRFCSYILTPMDATAAFATREVVLRALGRLTMRERLVLVFRFYMDMSELEIANELKIAPGTVKSAASRALAKLRCDAELQAERIA